jgi:uncharacterized protein
MKRIIDYYLLQWKHYQLRKPLLLRGARQVGKTFAVRQLGTTYDNFVEINLEFQIKLRVIFEKTLDPYEIIRDISIALQQPIIPGKTLLFIDEIQIVPQAITALRYFYEMMPELHVIGAGSLLDVVIMQIGAPTGRVQFLHMYPVSFIEYVAALHPALCQQIIEHSIEQTMPTIFHEQLLVYIAQYLALGGMPEVLHNWIAQKNALHSHISHASILHSYRQDFNTYAPKKQVGHVEQVFQAVTRQLGQKFKYNLIEGDYRKKDLVPALDLLVAAGIAHKIYYATAQGIPMAFQVDTSDYKVILLDVGLTQADLGFNVSGWFIKPEQEFVNKGSLVEAFVGQELVAYACPYMKNDLYYWHKASSATQAEIDYLVQINEQIIPVEVKSGSGRTLKSIHYFLETHKQTSYGIKFSTNNYSQFDHIHSYPLYAIAQPVIEHNQDMKAAIQSLV